MVAAAAAAAEAWEYPLCTELTVDTHPLGCSCHVR